MKRLVLMLSVVIAAAFVFAACNKEEKADLAWKNESASSASINNIIWADGNAEWINGTTGYTYGTTTDSKEVDELTGEVGCLVDVGDGFEAASVAIGGTQDPTLTLKDGESYVYTIEASPAAKK